MFGNLTLAFVRFGTALQSIFAPGAGPEAMQEFNVAADSFKRSAADDALYLVCIGEFPLFPWHQGASSGFCHRRDFDFLYAHTTQIPTPSHPFAPFPRACRGGSINLVTEC
jgi:hypothetical protein